MQANTKMSNPYSIPAATTPVYPSISHFSTRSPGTNKTTPAASTDSRKMRFSILQAILECLKPAIEAGAFLLPICSFLFSAWAIFDLK